MTMKDIEPSPIEELPPGMEDGDIEKSSSTDPKMKNDPYFPPATNSSSSSRSTWSVMGLSSSSFPYTVPQVLHALQKYAVVPPLMYLTMHYTNTALIPLVTRDVSKADDYLLLTRPYYQSSAVLEQLMIFVPLATHILSGIGLRLYHRRQNAKRHGAYTHADRRRIPWPKLSLTSALGYTLWPLLAVHGQVQRITPYKVDGGSSRVGLRYFAYVFAKHPVVNYVGYATFVTVASFHIVTGAAKFLKLSREYVTEGGDYGVHKRTKRSRIINAIAATIAAVWMAGGLGVVARAGASVGAAWEMQNWDRILSKVPVIGPWLL